MSMRVMFVGQFQNPQRLVKRFLPLTAIWLFGEPLSTVLHPSLDFVLWGKGINWRVDEYKTHLAISLMVSYTHCGTLLGITAW